MALSAALAVAVMLRSAPTAVSSSNRSTPSVVLAQVRGVVESVGFLAVGWGVGMVDGAEKFGQCFGRVDSLEEDGEIAQGGELLGRVGDAVPMVDGIGEIAERFERVTGARP